MAGVLLEKAMPNDKGQSSNKIQSSNVKKF
jgi:hypothetical protein